MLRVTFPAENFPVEKSSKEKIKQLFFVNKKLTTNSKCIQLIILSEKYLK